MSGLFGGKVRGPSAEEQAARARAEERASAEETTAMQAAMGRRRLRRTGGMRLLFSPIRQMMQTKLGGGE